MNCLLRRSQFEHWQALEVKSDTLCTHLLRKSSRTLDIWISLPLGSLRVSEVTAQEKRRCTSRLATPEYTHRNSWSTNVVSTPTINSRVQRTVVLFEVMVLPERGPLRCSREHVVAERAAGAQCCENTTGATWPGSTGAARPIPSLPFSMSLRPNLNEFLPVLPVSRHVRCHCWCDLSSAFTLSSVIHQSDRTKWRIG